MKTKEQIIEWLKSWGLYEAFAKNISPRTIEEVVVHNIAEETVPELIRSSFWWLNTNEGSDFWNSANDKFLLWLESDEQTDQPLEDEQADQPLEDEQTEEDGQSKSSSDSVQSTDRWIFDRGCKEAPFYMVYADGKSSPTYKHGSMEEATKEADRLAKFLNTKTYVLAAVMEIRPEIVTSAVGIDDMEHQVDNPF